MDVVQSVKYVSNEKQNKYQKDTELPLEELLSVRLPFEVNDCLDCQVLKNLNAVRLLELSHQPFWFVVKGLRYVDNIILNGVHLTLGIQLNVPPNDFIIVLIHLLDILVRSSSYHF